MVDKARAEQLGLHYFEPPLASVRIPKVASGATAPDLHFRSLEEQDRATSACESLVARRCRQGSQRGCALEALKHCRCLPQTPQDPRNPKALIFLWAWNLSSSLVSTPC